MSCWAMVAVKSRTESKRRLAGVLDARERSELVRRMLGHVLTVASSCEAVDQLVVVSPECDDLPQSAALIHDSGMGLNEAATLALARARERGVRELIVLPADLPRLTAADLDALIEAGRRSGAAIGSDLAGTGTNALYLTTSMPFEFAYGPGSLHAHVAASRSAGCEPVILRRPGLEFDVDTPDDPRELMGGSPARPPHWRWSYSAAGH